MTQDSDPTHTTRPGAPGQIPTRGYPAPGQIPTQGYPAPGHIPTQGYPPPGSPFPAPPGWAVQGQPAPGQPFHGQPVPPNRDRRPLGIVIGVVAAVVVVVAGILTWTLISSTAPSAAPPTTAQPATAPAGSAGSADSPEAAAAARQQFDAAFTRFSQAGVRFGRDAQQAGTSNNRELGRSAVTDFRAAAYAFDTDIRRITFPNAQQTVVNTQLLVATGRLVTDLDQLSYLDPATMQAAGDQMVKDDRTTVQLSRQILTSFGT